MRISLSRMWEAVTICSVDMEAIWSSSTSSTAIVEPTGVGDDDIPHASEVGTGGSNRSSSSLRLGREEATEVREMSDMGKVERWCLMVIVRVWAKMLSSGPSARFHIIKKKT
jgi:hypothetical protein